MDTDITTEPIVTVGVDVGGVKKGFHAIAMRGRTILSKTSSCNPTEIATWCREIGAHAVAVDAPISWSKSGRARSAERALMQRGIWCFSTPIERVAKVHPANHFGWMLQGAKLYRALDKSFVRFNGNNDCARLICLETFPHAVACALNGAPVSARNKRKVRRALLAKAGIDCDALTNIDLVDAALCALTAQYFARGQHVHYGDAKEGYIVVPRSGGTSVDTKSDTWYEELRTQYRPSKIRILLIGESPPDPRGNERRFFYSPILKADNLYRSVTKALYGRERAFDVACKVENLARMKSDGIWLIDATDAPINLKIRAQRRQAIRNGIPKLLKRVKEAASKVGVIICHSLVYGECAAALRRAKAAILHSESLPFPLGNTRAEFIAGMRRALAWASHA